MDEIEGLRTTVAAISSLLKARHFEEADQFATKALERGTAGAEVDIRHLRAMARREQGRLREALEDMGKCVALDSSNGMAWLHMGQLHAALGDATAACEAFSRAVDADQGIAEASFLHGRCLLDQSRAREAANSFRRASEEIPGVPLLQCWLALALAQAGETDSATRALDRIRVGPDGDGETWFQLGRAYAAVGLPEQAELAYRAALDREDVARGAVLNNLGLLLQDIGRRNEAVQRFHEAVSVDPENWRAVGNLVGCMLDLGDSGQTVRSTLNQLTERFPTVAQVWAAAGIAWEKLRERTLALAALNRALELGEQAPYARRARLRVAQSLCDWTHFDGDVAWLRDHCMAHDTAPDMFALLSVPGLGEATLMRRAMQVGRHLDRFAQPRVESRFESGVRAGGPIRVGYISSDFHAHATAYLMAGVFEAHDREVFEIHGYSLGPNDHSAMRLRLEAGFDVFHELAGLDDRVVAERIAGDGIDILVDLKGYTENGRPLVLAFRPAPVQVSYLGYPGTMGTPFVDYIIADDTVLPATSHRHYSEKVAWIPGSYQCNDNKRAGEASTARADHWLPDDALVLCCFNNPYKITPDFLDIWCRLLVAAPQAVLWLFADGEVVQENLRREVRARGVSPDRMIFARYLSHDQHLARLALADLFLDTLPYNAHTTASDALWMGVPVLTCVGDTFAGRVGASLLKAVNLSEMITDSPDRYEALGRALVTDPARLAAPRQRLLMYRKQCRLFDTEGFTSDLEALYQSMWERHQAGLPPANLVL